MTLYDAGMVCLILGGMVWGAWRGIVWQLASIASLVLGYAVAHTASDDLAAHFHFPGDPIVARGLAMVVIYVVVSGGVFFAAWLVRATLRRLNFEAYDRHLGMVLGGLEGVLLGLVVTLFVVSLAPKSRGPIFASPTGKIAGKIMVTLGPVLPSEAREVLAPFWKNETTVVDSDAQDEPNQKPAEAGPAKIETTRTSEAHGRSRTTERR
jgi:membrane protein required for colicin V production